LWWRLLTGALVMIEVAALLAASALAIFFFQPYGERRAIAVGLAAILGGLILALSLSHKRRGSSVTLSRDSLSVARILPLAAKVLIGTFGCWLGLIGWSAWSAGGSMPAAKSDPRIIRVVTWNILHGTEHGAPWNRFGWPVRKSALERVLLGTAPDILCVQEALEEQVNGLAKVLSGHNRVGVGRDDGHSAGEFCAIFFDRGRFDELDAGTFWLEEPTDEPPRNTYLGPKRICTWVRLRDRQTMRAFRVYNTHLYLTEGAQLIGVKIILGRIALGDSTDAVLITGDFNATPESQSRLLPAEAGLKSSDEPAGDSRGAATYQFYGIRLKSLDDVLADPEWHVEARRVLDAKPGNTFPSDHFGVMADLILRVGPPAGSGRR
jgi:endonuclease/exonuclease/phosphatase family metal-dependent hydrolase